MSLEKDSDEMGRSAIKIKKCVAYLMWQITFMRTLDIYS